MYIIKFLIVYIVFKIKNALRTLKASFGLWKKNDVLIKKKSVHRSRQEILPSAQRYVEEDLTEMYRLS